MYETKGNGTVRSYVGLIGLNLVRLFLGEG